jgi:hypothetical protein
MCSAEFNTADDRPTNKAATKTVEPRMFPDGLAHNFGTVIRGTICEHSFRIINTTDAPLQILTLRKS